jgi:Tc5 transposase C-terminal domain
VTCSSSGKLTTSLVEYWRDHVLRPFAPPKSLLLSDYWSGQRRPEIYSAVNGCERLEIPAGTTSRIQPLDVYFNRQWKVLARRIFDHVQLDDIAINLSERNNVIRLNSLIHNQLSSPLFIPMIKYAWFASSYIEHHPGAFESVNEVCFNVDGSFCQQSHCDSLPFIRCSHCRKFVCFEHFFEAYHYHD